MGGVPRRHLKLSLSSILIEEQSGHFYCRMKFLFSLLLQIYLLVKILSPQKYSKKKAKVLFYLFSTVHAASREQSQCTFPCLSRILQSSVHVCVHT